MISDTIARCTVKINLQSHQCYLCATRLGVFACDCVCDCVCVCVFRAGYYHNGEDTMSKALVLRLDRGDTLRMVAEKNTNIFSDSGLQTSFIGFLLYPS